MKADPPRIDQLMIAVRSGQVRCIAPDLLERAERIAARPTEPMTDDQLHAWAARLVADVVGAND